MALDNDRCIDLAVAEIRSMADLCRGADPATPVPSCPGWTLADLVDHTGGVHRWASTMVEQASQDRIRRDQMELGQPADPAQLPDWLAAGADVVEARFRAADPSTPMWAWGWPKTARFWPRRMVHETGIHRADTELALGRSPAFDADVAADGIDELLGNLSHAVYFAPAIAELEGSGETIRFVAVDSGDAWRITLVEGGFGWRRDENGVDEAYVSFRAPAGDLLLTVYGRRRPQPGEVTGDEALLERWLVNSAL